MPGGKSDFRSSRVSNVERFAGKLHEPFIEGLALKGVGLLYQKEPVVDCGGAGRLGLG
jgi:hypothetical protein